MRGLKRFLREMNAAPLMMIQKIHHRAILYLIKGKFYRHPNSSLYWLSAFLLPVVRSHRLGANREISYRFTSEQ